MADFNEFLLPFFTVGCLNGGAQLRSDAIETKTLTSEMEALHSQLSKRQLDEVAAQQISNTWLGNLSLEEQLKKYKTSYHSVVKSTNALTVKW